MSTPTITEQMSTALRHHSAGKLLEAETLYRGILAQQPLHAPAMGMLGLIALQTGHLQPAEELLRRSVQINPNDVEIQNNLGQALRALGRWDEARACYEATIKLDPSHAGARNNMGGLLLAAGRFEEAEAMLRQSVQLNPLDTGAWTNLGCALLEQGRLDEAIETQRRAVAVNPDHPHAQLNLGNAITSRDHAEAERAYRRAIEIQPRLAAAHNNLGGLLLTRGDYDGAIACYRKATEIQANYLNAHENLLLSMSFHPTLDPSTVYAEHVAWAKHYAEGLAPAKPVLRRAAGARPLRIGYVSGDFRAHAVATFIEPVIHAHDRKRFEVYCYHDHRHSDEVTKRLRSAATNWRDIAGQSDDAVAEMIRKDRIDILVDLAGHTSPNRMLVFARKPAPIQVSYLGYPNTTGLRTIDFRLTDAHADPVGESDRYHTEKLHRLPGCQWCYVAPLDAPLAAPRDVDGGAITFGSFNKLAKIGDGVIAAWAKVLLGVAGSRMIIKSAGLDDATLRRGLLDRFAAVGISADRLDLRAHTASFADHLATYAEVDITLDTFPYNGTTTTCEAMWMGVSVIALAGRTHAARVGVSLLNAVGLPELVAPSEADYVRIAVELASDLPRLNQLRSSLRDRMKAGPLTDAGQFTRNLEAAFESFQSAS